MKESTYPIEWCRVTLGEIADWGSGGTPSRKQPEYYDGDVPWIKTGDLGPRVLASANEYITELGVKNSSAKLFPKNSVAIAMYGATIGRTSILGFDATTNQACAVGQPVKGVTDSVFLYYLLRNEKDAFIAKGKGGAQPNISQTLIKEHLVALPSIEEQKVIADKLDTLLAQVEATEARLERIPKILKRFRQSVLAKAVGGTLMEMTSDPLQSWEKSTFGEIALDIRYGTSKKCSGSEGGIPVLRIPNIGNGVVELDNLKFANFEESEYAKLALQPGDLLLIRSNGSLDLVGKVALIQEKDVDCLYAGYLIRLRLNEKVVIPEFALMNLQSPSQRAIIEETAKSTSGVNNINSKEISNLEISLPPLPDQREIVNRVNKLFDRARHIEQQANNALAQINKLTQSILAKTFRGELTEQWRKDNPDLISGENSAEVLLRKIQAKREFMAPKRKVRKKTQ